MTYSLPFSTYFLTWSSGVSLHEEESSSLSRELYPAISLPTTLFSYSTSLSLLSILVLTMEEEDIVVGFETVGPRSHEKEELPDSISSRLVSYNSIYGFKKRPFLPTLPVFPVQYLIFL